MGVSVERVWHQTTPQGDLAIVYEEADDLAQGLPRLAASQEPFDVWFKQQVLEIHGVDFNQHYLDRCRNWSSTEQDNDVIAASAAATARGDSTTSI